jgi:hypothetical protein
MSSDLATVSARPGVVAKPRGGWFRPVLGMRRAGAADRLGAAELRR